jgi:hypothetical protein
MKVIVSCFLLLNILTSIQGQNTLKSKPNFGREKLDSLKQILQRNPAAFIEESFKLEKEILNEKLLIELYHLQVDYLDKIDNYDLTSRDIHDMCIDFIDSNGNIDFTVWFSSGPTHKAKYKFEFVISMTHVDNFTEKDILSKTLNGALKQYGLEVQFMESENRTIHIFIGKQILDG